MFRSINVFDDIFNFQREADRLFRDMWATVPRAQQATPFPVTVETSNDEWRIKIAMPGIDPKDVTVDVAGTTLTVRAEHAGGRRDGETRYDQAIALPQFLDVDRITAAHRHGLLELTVPVKDAVRPRRIQIEGIEAGEQKQLTTS